MVMNGTKQHSNNTRRTHKTNLGEYLVEGLEDKFNKAPLRVASQWFLGKLAAEESLKVSPNYLWTDLL